MKKPLSPKLRRARATALSSILGLACAAMPGCATFSGTEVDRFATGHVRVVHSEQHCGDLDPSTAALFPNADRVESIDHGLGLLAATKASWEVLARELAAEVDADIALIRPCDGKRRGFEYAHIEVWRTRGFDPAAKGEPDPANGTLSAPSRSTYGTRLQDIHACLDQARVTRDPISPESRKRLASIVATDYFSPGPYFAGWARIDRYYRPARTGDLSLTMTHAERRLKADWAAGIYQRLSPMEQQPFAERYLACLWGRGYRWQPVDGAN